MGKEVELLNMLSKNEIKVHDYIKEKAEKQGSRLKESMKSIGNNLGISEATVHRAIRKLRKSGIIGVVPSIEKAETNEIVYYGLPDEEKQVDEIFDMVSNLSSSMSRFQSILESKDLENNKMKRENENLHNQLEEAHKQIKENEDVIRQLQKILSEYEKENPLLSQARIISITELGDGATALIFKEK